jgi:hypothetical protein
MRPAHFTADTMLAIGMNCESRAMPGETSMEPSYSRTSSLTLWYQYRK